MGVAAASGARPAEDPRTMALPTAASGSFERPPQVELRVVVAVAQPSPAERFVHSRRLAERGVVCSMSRRGNPYDNADLDELAAREERLDDDHRTEGETATVTGTVIARA